MRYIKVWDAWEDVPESLRSEAVLLIGTYFQENDVINTINDAYGDGTWEGLIRDDQQDVLKAVNDAFIMDETYNWDDILLDAIPDDIIPIRGRINQCFMCAEKYEFGLEHNNKSFCISCFVVKYPEELKYLAEVIFDQLSRK